MASGFILTVVPGPLISTTDNQPRKDIRRTPMESNLHRIITTVSANTALPARLALRHLLTVGSLKCRRRATRRIPVTLTACFLFLLPRFRHFGSSTFISGCYRPLRQVLRGQPRAYTPHFCLSVLYLYRKLRDTSAVLQTQVSLSLFLLELCS